jgi:predicted AAA+ superfamily ATPase
MHQRQLLQNLSRSRPFCLFGAAGVGKTTLLRDFAGKFSNCIHLDLETATDRAFFQPDAMDDDPLTAISFLKGKEIRGNGTLIVLDEIGRCPEAIRWVGGRADQKGPLVVATSSFQRKELAQLTNPVTGNMQPQFLYPFSFEEFLPLMDDAAALEAFREVPVPYYAYEKLLTYFHLYALIGGMPEITSEYAATHRLTGLKKVYEKIESRFIHCLPDVTAGVKSLNLAVEVFRSAFPYASTRIRFNRFGNLDKGSREIGKAFHSLERAFFLQMILPVTSSALPMVPDTSKFPKLQLLDTGLVNYFSGIQKPLFHAHDMNAIFEGQIARQVVGQEILAAQSPGAANGSQIRFSETGAMQELNFWVRDKAQSTAEVDFVIPYNDLLIPVVVRSGEPGRLRSLHQFMDIAPHTFAVRLYAGKLAVQQTRTIRGKKFHLMNLPYFLAGKIRDHLVGFRKYVEG